MVFGAGGGEGGSSKIEHALFGGLFGAVGNFVELFFAHHVDGSFDQIAHHGFDVAADVADFGVFRGFHFDERAARQPRKATGDFGLADAGWADHQNILGKNIFGDLRRKLLAADAIAQSDGDGALRRVLPDDVLVELRDDLARRHVVERGKKFFFLGGGRCRCCRARRQSLCQTCWSLILRFDVLDRVFPYQMRGSADNVFAIDSSTVKLALV